MAGKSRTERSDPGWRYPLDVQDEFRRWCDQMGYGYESEAAAAIYAWSRLPAELRERAKRSMATGAKFEPPGRDKSS